MTFFSILHLSITILMGNLTFLTQTKYWRVKIWLKLPVGVTTLPEFAYIWWPKVCKKSTIQKSYYVISSLDCKLSEKYNFSTYILAITRLFNCFT